MSKFNNQFATQRLREEEIEENNSVIQDTRRFIMYMRDLDTEIEKSKYSEKLYSLTNQLRSAQDSQSASEIIDSIARVINSDSTIDRVSKFDTLKIIEKIKGLYPEASIDETSATGGEGAYLTKAGAKRQTPKPTSGYKDVKGFRPGHSKLKVVEPKDLWNVNEDQFNEIIARQDKDKVEKLLAYVKDKAPDLYRRFLGWMSEPYPHDYDEFAAAAGINEKQSKLSINEMGMKQEPEKSLNYDTGEKLEVGDRVKIDNKLEGVINGFAYNNEDKKETIFVNVDKGDNSTAIRANMPFFENQLQLIKKAPINQVNPSDAENEEEPLQEGIKQQIRSRNKAQQFHEAAKQANKKLEEVNKILEYAAELKNGLHEEQGSQSIHSTRLMEKAKKRMVSAYAKMKKLEE